MENDSYLNLNMDILNVQYNIHPRNLKMVTVTGGRALFGGGR